MSRLTQILIAFGAVLALVLVILMMAGIWGSSVPSRTVEASFGDHLVTVKGHYQDLKQETLAEGLLITVDGQKIAVTNDQVTAAGLTHALQPGQDVEILVNDKGDVEVKVAEPGG
ncbi:MAG: hypothetical protein FJX44_00710 [Alphaproteobacteria bacterium]|nr:hypothetical protein [Alphaproteobacteria bacterium]